MAGSVTRRSLLATGSAAAGALLGGCLLDNPEETASNVYVENTASREVRLRLWVGQLGEVVPRETDAGTDHGPVREATERAGPGPATGTAGYPFEAVIHGVYRVPEGTALGFENALREGQRYRVQAALEAPQPSDRVVATVPACTGDPDADRVVSVRTRPDGLGVIPWGCDEDYTLRDGLEYVDADEYRVATVTGRFATAGGERDDGD